MLKKILIVLLALLFMSGCTPSSQSVVLEDVGESITVDAASSASAGNDDTGSVSGTSGKTDSASAGTEAAAENVVAVDGAGAGDRLASSEITSNGSAQLYTSADQKLAVYVCGAVESAGVYELPEGSRIVDAVDAAGGFAESADRSYVNLAARVTDGMRLQIPTMEEASNNNPAKEIESFDSVSVAATTQVTGGVISDGLININTATKEELKILSGIGDSTADKIIRYREDNGGFKQIEDIMKVSGIKEKLFSKIRDKITV